MLPVKACQTHLAGCLLFPVGLRLPYEANENYWLFIRNFDVTGCSVFYQAVFSGHSPVDLMALCLLCTTGSLSCRVWEGFAHLLKRWELSGAGTKLGSLSG